MYFTVAEDNNASNPNNYINYSDVDFSDIPSMVMADCMYCACRLKDEYRIDSNFDGCVDILIIDIDDGCTIEQAKFIFSKYEFYLITTKSHQLNKGGVVCDRYRLFLKLDKTVNIKEQMDEIYSRFIDKYNFIDKACRNVSRPYYASPTDAIIYYNTGKPYRTALYHFSDDSTKQSPTKPIKVAQNSTSCDYIWKYDELNECYVGEHGEIDSFTPNGETNEENKLKGIRAFLDTDFYQGNKSSCLFSAGCLMVDDGFSDDVVVDFLMNEWETRKDSTDKFKDALKNIKGALKKRK